jgi:hypothetical protein
LKSANETCQRCRFSQQVKNGWTGEEGADKTSFDEMFHLFFPKGRKPLTFEEASNELIKQNKQLETEQEYYEQSED